MKRFSPFVFILCAVLLLFFSACTTRRPVPKSPPSPLPVQKKRVKVSLSTAPADKKREARKPFFVRPAKKLKKIEKKRKKRFFSNAIQAVSYPPETVEIGGKKYPVPPAWRGKKLTVPLSIRHSLLQLPAEYVHGKGAVYVKKEAFAPLIQMMDDAALEGIILQVETAYRDVDTQKRIFLRKFKEGRSWDDVVRYVAPPGYSEHMLGLAIDFYPSGWRFAQTAGYHWLKTHAGKYCFVESYPQVPIPGHAKIAWESWHWFYTGCHREGRGENSLLNRPSEKRR